MDQGIARCFVDAAREVLMEIGLAVSEAHPVRASDIPAGDRCLIATIGLVGDVSGSFLVRMDTEAARAIIAAMYRSAGVRDPLDREISDAAVAELANQITGRAITYLSRRSVECDMTPPAVIAGTDLTSAMPGVTDIVYHRLQGAHGSLLLLLGLKG